MKIENQWIEESVQRKKASDSTLEDMWMRSKDVWSNCLRKARPQQTARVKFVESCADTRLKRGRCKQQSNSRPCSKPKRTEYGWKEGRTWKSLYFCMFDSEMSVLDSLECLSVGRGRCWRKKKGSGSRVEGRCERVPGVNLVSRNGSELAYVWKSRIEPGSLETNRDVSKRQSMSRFTKSFSCRFAVRSACKLYSRGLIERTFATNPI